MPNTASHSNAVTTDRRRVRPVAAVLLSLGLVLCLLVACSSGTSRKDTATDVRLSRPSRPPPITSFPFGVYDKKELTPAEDPRLMPYQEFEAYYARAFDLLQSHGLNSFVATYFCPADVAPDGVPRMEKLLDWAHERSIRVVMRVNPTGCQQIPGPSSRFFLSLTHPAVVAYMYGDEPELHEVADYRTQVARLREAGFHRPVVSSLVLEGMTRNGGPPVETWEELSPRVRMGRLYPFRRSDQGLADGDPLTAAEKMAVVEASGPTPWWYVYQAFGTDGLRPVFRNPRPTELTAQMHLALAHGARALIAYSLQNERSDWVGLTDQDLRIADDKLATIRNFVHAVGPHGDLLLRHRRAPGSVRVDRADVEAVPRIDPDTGETFVYVVNLRSIQATTATLTFSEPFTAAVDLYSGKRHAVIPSASRSTVSVKLAAGEGQLIALGRGDR